MNNATCSSPISANNTLTPVNISVASIKPKIVVNFDGIPQFLKEQKRWINWHFTDFDSKKGKFRKVPIGIEWQKEENWLTFDEAKQNYNDGNNGIGIVLWNGNITTFDIDEIDLERLKRDFTLFTAGGFSPLYNQTSNCYTEKSIYGRGLHIIIEDKRRSFISRLSANPIICQDCDHIEIFTHADKRWLAITGNVDEYRKDVRELTIEEEVKIFEWMKESDKYGHIVKKPIIEYDNTPLKNVPLNFDKFPFCIKSTLIRLGKGLGVDHPQRVLAASFLFRIGLNIVEVADYFKNSDDYDPNETAKQLSQIFEKKGYIYGCDKVCNWIHSDDGKPVCNNDCKGKINPVNNYLLNIGNIEISEDEIKNLMLDETKPLIFNMKNNLLTDWIDYHSTLSDAFTDYHHASGLMALSIISDRKACIELKQSTIYCNMWVFLIGQSTMSRKSTVYGHLHEFDYILKRGRRELPNQFSPEAFIETMSECPHSYYLLDECASLLKGINQKSYMADMRDILCSIYDNTSFARLLRTKKNKAEKTEFKINKPYMPTMFATVPSNIQRFTDYDDLSSGYMIRFLYYVPKYAKKFMPLTQKCEDDNILKSEISKKLSDLDEFFTNLTEPIYFILDDDANEFFVPWNEQIETSAANITDDILQSGIGRLEIYAFKLAILFEIADNNFIERFKSLNDPYNKEHLFTTKGMPRIELNLNDPKYEKIEVLTSDVKDVEVNEVNKFGKYTGRNTYPITLEKIREACNEIDYYFIPMLERVKVLVESSDNKNCQQKIINLLKRNGGALPRSDLSRLSRLTRKEMDDALLVLSQDSEEIELREVKGKTKNISYIILKS